jgi:hypothetical protein
MCCNTGRRILTPVLRDRVNYGSDYEKQPFPTGGGPSSDFLYMLLIGATCLYIIANFLGLMLIGQVRGVQQRSAATAASLR